MFSGDYEPVVSRPARRGAEEETAGRDVGDVPPRELTPDLPPNPDTRQRATNQSRAYDGERPGRRLGAFAVGASGRVPRQPNRPPSPESPTGR